MAQKKKTKRKLSMTPSAVQSRAWRAKQKEKGLTQHGKPFRTKTQKAAAISEGMKKYHRERGTGKRKTRVFGKNVIGRIKPGGAVELNHCYNCGADLRPMRDALALLMHDIQEYQNND